MRYDFNRGWMVERESGGAAEEKSQPDAAGPGKKIDLPYDAMIHEPRRQETNNGDRSGFYPGGCYLYKKRFMISREMLSCQILLCFDGAYGLTTVLVNGHEVCRHAYGFTAFEADISGAVAEGENEVQVKCDNSYTPNCRWYSGSGLIRPVSLLVRPWEHIEDVEILTRSVSPAEVEIKACVRNSRENGSRKDEPAPVTVEIMDGEDCIYSGSAGRITLPGAALWSAESPKLYLARLKSEKDCVEKRFGIRKLSWSAREGFLVNGEETKLRGCCLHSDNGILGACTYPDAELRKVRILKENGYNAIRSAHNPCSEELLEACDSLGMYVIDELYDGWYIPKTYHDSARYFQETWRDSVRAMVEKDRNHPSVIMYSIGNEVTEPRTEEGIRTGRALIQEIKGLDGERPVTCGLNIMLMKWNSTFTEQGEYRKEHLPDCEVKDEGGSAFFNALMLKLGAAMGIFVKGRKSDRMISGLADSLDIVGYNYGECRYDEEGKANPGRILLGSETLVGRQWYNWPRVMKHPYLIGDFVWTGFDYIGEANIGHWKYENKKGLPLLYGGGTIDITGKADAQMAYQQAVWGELPEPYLGVRPLDIANVRCIRRNWRMTDVYASWTWHGHEGERTAAEVFADAPYVRLLRNGEVIGTKKIRKYKASFKVKYEPGTLTAVLLDREKKETGRTELVTAGAAERILVQTSKDILRANGQDLCYMDFTIVDKDGYPVPDSEWEISIRLPEDSKVSLAGFGSAAPVTGEGFTSNLHKTYYGRAQAVFRAGYEDGDTEVEICAGPSGTRQIVKLSCVKGDREFG